MSAPQSVINVCAGVGINNRYEHTIYFDNKGAQEDFFAGKTVKVFPAYSYLRKSWPLKVEATMEEAKTWTYLYFRNGSSGKVYYYFINTVEYVNDNTVELGLELDVIQTYMFDYVELPCFVERQHTATDEPGQHTVEEGLDTGEYTVGGSEVLPMQELAIMIMSTFDLETNLDFVGGLTDGCFTGLNISAVKYSEWAELGLRIRELDADGRTDGIINMWMYPKNLIKLYGEETWEDGNTFHGVSSVEPFFTERARPTMLKGYTPKNKKLLTYPYSFLYATNNLGESAVYRYERFGDPTACILRTVGAVGAGGAVRTYPLNYNGEQHAYEHGLTLGSWPTCAWNQDVYKLWLAQNQNQHALSNITAGVTAAAGLGSVLVGNLAGLGTAVSGATQIAGHVAQMKDRAIQPPAAKGAASASVNVACTFQAIEVMEKMVTPEYARIIDNYFTMYGYKINRLQQPQRAVRKAFTYVKTIGAHITGNLCNEDLDKIAAIYDKGITFWRDGDHIGDYTLDNSPMEV